MCETANKYEIQENMSKPNWPAQMYLLFLLLHIHKVLANLHTMFSWSQFFMNIIITFKKVTLAISLILF